MKVTLQTCAAKKNSVHVDGGRAEGLVCADPEARTRIVVSRIKQSCANLSPEQHHKTKQFDNFSFLLFMKVSFGLGQRFFIVRESAE